MRNSLFKGERSRMARSLRKIIDKDNSSLKKIEHFKHLQYEDITMFVDYDCNVIERGINNIIDLNILGFDVTGSLIYYNLSAEEIADVIKRDMSNEGTRWKVTPTIPHLSQIHNIINCADNDIVERDLLYLANSIVDAMNLLAWYTNINHRFKLYTKNKLDKVIDKIKEM